MTPDQFPAFHFTAPLSPRRRWRRTLVRSVISTALTASGLTLAAVCLARNEPRVQWSLAAVLLVAGGATVNPLAGLWVAAFGRRARWIGL